MTNSLPLEMYKNWIQTAEQVKNGFSASCAREQGSNNKKGEEVLCVTFQRQLTFKIIFLYD